MHALGALYCRCSFNVRYGTSRALAIANGGQIVGDSETNRGESFRHAFLWQENVMRDLGAEVDGAGRSQAAGINDINEVVGTVNGRAFLARDGLSYELGVLPGHTSSDARAINNKGQVVGNSVTETGVSHAFLWNLGTMRNLGPLPGDISSQAQALNVGGDVVGRSGSPTSRLSRAVIWQDGVAIGPEPADDIVRLDSLERDGDQRFRADCRRRSARRSGPGVSSESAVTKNLRSTTGDRRSQRLAEVVDRLPHRQIVDRRWSLPSLPPGCVGVATGDSASSESLGCCRSKYCSSHSEPNSSTRRFCRSTATTLCPPSDGFGSGSLRAIGPPNTPRARFQPPRRIRCEGGW